jgi:uncharacterized protein (DUF952 family)
MHCNIAYKIVKKTNWDKFIRSRIKECRGFDNDLIDGFIHLSTHEQIYSTFIKKYSLSDKNKFNLLAIDLKVSNDVRWEIEKNGILYPHLYSPIILDHNILWIYGLSDYQFNANGI